MFTGSACFNIYQTGNCYFFLFVFSLSFAFLSLYSSGGESKESSIFLFRMQNRVCTALATYLHAVACRQFVISVGFEICSVSTTATATINTNSIVFHYDQFPFRLLFHFPYTNFPFSRRIADNTYLLFAVVSTSSRLPLVSGTALSGAGSAANTTAAAPTFPGELEELQSVLHFPEEVALRITDAEYQLFYQVKMKITHRHVRRASERKTIEKNPIHHLSLVCRNKYIHE